MANQGGRKPRLNLPKPVTTNDLLVEILVELRQMNTQLGNIDYALSRRR